jgi:hypothetical protein
LVQNSTVPTTRSISTTDTAVAPDATSTSNITPTRSISTTDTAVTPTNYDVTTTDTTI